MNEQTFVIIKPDAITRKLVGKIIGRFEDIGLYIEHIEKRLKNITWCQLHYAHIYLAQNAGRYGKKDVCGLQERFMTELPTIGIILVGENAIERVKRMVGATHCPNAIPGTIRGDWGIHSGCCNLIHASEFKREVNKEIELYFDKETDQ